MTAAPATRVRVRVPATSANLGPGFDSFGLALGLYDDVVVEPTGSGVRVEVSGEGENDVSRDTSNLVVSSMLAAFDAMGGRPAGLVVRCTNRIPHGRGLGSSSAAIVAGIVAARALGGGGSRRLTDDELLTLADRIEGHPDNVAAALLGGFTIAWRDADGPHVLRQDVAAGLVAIAFVPATAVATTTARRLLPELVPHADAARNAGRAALLVAALTHRPDLLLAATQDWLHQGYRQPAMPRSAQLVGQLRDRGIAAVVSGAGPTVLALAAEAEGAAFAGHCPPDMAAIVLPLEPRGAHVVPDDA